ncbi:MAG: folylpolyglutamate synthase/dihydrofolate synthase family protein [Actinomycetaceae bacterium]|nr:folylpolyglutamate synthase/dihydrofolate synthase family protein [Actinomycetaceae bacterium]
MSNRGAEDGELAQFLEQLDAQVEAQSEAEVSSEDLVAEVMNRDVSAGMREVLSELHMLPDDDGAAGGPGADGQAAEQDLDATQTAALMRRVEKDIIARAPEHQVQPSLERVQLAMHILGDPQHAYRSIHLTGTNGKTSTSRMIDSLLQASGRRVGRFTSPHLNTIRERICLNGEPLSEEGFLAAYADVAPYLEMVDAHSAQHDGPRMSFFEVLTTMAYAAFADAPVDVAVMEVGMGGQWDATNVIDADVAVITPIAKDHEKWLGATVEEIAREKVGIIKPGAVVVSAVQEPSVEAIIRKACEEKGATLRMLGEEIDLVSRQVGVGGQLISVRTPAATYEDIALPLLGVHQATNAALALAAVEAFNSGRALEGNIVEEGFGAATSPGRLEVVRSSPSIIVDAAHNPHGAAALVAAVEESFDYSTIVGVYSAMADKNVEAVLAEVEPLLDEIVITGMDSPRAMSVEELTSIAADVFGAERVWSEPALLDAIDRAVERSEIAGDPAASSGVVVFGSVVLAGAARALVLGK